MAGTGLRPSTRGHGAVLPSCAAEPGLVVLFAPLDVVLGASVVEPDILVAPLLVVEIGSLPARWLDQGRKRSLCEEYSVVFIVLVEPAITVLELRGGPYVEAAHARGDQAIVVEAALNPAVPAIPRQRSRAGTPPVRSRSAGSLAAHASGHPCLVHTT